MQPGASQRYHRGLDGLRGMGILFVAGYHFLLLSDYDWTVLGFTWIWIQMFFVQSGFLITRILLDLRGERLGMALGRFYWRRVLRIFPIYFAYLLLPAITFLLLDLPRDFDRRALGLFTYTYNFADAGREVVRANLWFIHFWSLSVEEQFYLAWPWLVLLLRPVHLRYVLGAIVLLAPAFRFLYAEHLTGQGMTADQVGGLVYVHTLGQIDAFAIGAAIAVLGLNGRVRNSGRWAYGIAIAAFVAGMVNLVSLRQQGVPISVTSLGLTGHMTGNYQHIWSYTLISVLFGAMLLHVVRDDYSGIFANRLLVRIGRVAYGMYVLHMAVLILFDRWNERWLQNEWIAGSIGIVAVYVVAEVSYRFFESRFLALKNSRFARSRAAESSAPGQGVAATRAGRT